MNFVEVATVSAIVLGHPQKSRLLTGLNCILFCLNDSSQIAKCDCAVLLGTLQCKRPSQISAQVYLKKFKKPSPPLPPPPPGESTYSNIVVFVKKSIEVKQLFKC